MCRTRVKILHFDLSWGRAGAEQAINQFISDPKNKVAKVDSISVSSYYSGGLYAVATITYELGE